MSLTIELDAPSLEALNHDAEGLGISADELAGRILRGYAERRPHKTVMSDADFRAALEASFRENAEAYRRLAQ